MTERIHDYRLNTYLPPAREALLMASEAVGSRDYVQADGHLRTALGYANRAKCGPLKGKIMCAMHRTRRAMIAAAN